MPATRFFFYGTLLDGSDNPVARDIHALLAPVGPATARGVLHGVPDPTGWFPALLEGEGVVHGRLYESRAHFSPADLARMDAYEDYAPGNEAASLYVRRPLSVTGPDDASGEAQVYVFNQPLPPGSEPIAAGDFRAWLSARGLRQFTGLREA